MRAQGRAAWRRFNDAMLARRVPHAEALDGALVIFGGALLLTPGFITDVLLGLLLLDPPLRLARRIVGEGDRQADARGGGGAQSRGPGGRPP